MSFLGVDLESDGRWLLRRAKALGYRLSSVLEARSNAQFYDLVLRVWTATDTGTPTYATSQRGIGVSYDGSSSTIAPGAVFGETFSRIAIIQTSTVSGDGSISGNSVPGNGGPQFRRSGTEIRLLKANVAQIVASSGAGLSTGKFAVVGVTYDGTTGVLYCNGRQVGSAASAQTFSAQGAGSIGGRGDDNTNERFSGLIFLHADISGVAISDAAMRALTAGLFHRLSRDSGLPSLVPAGGAITADLSITEAPDTSAATAAAAIVATLNGTEAVDTLAATGTAVTSATTDATEAPDTLAAEATAPLAASLAATEAADTLSAGATAPLQAGATVTEAGDAASATAAAAIIATLSATEATDTLSAEGGAPAVVADMVATEQPDTLASQATLGLAADASLAELFDALASTVSATLAAEVGVNENGDTLAGAALVALILQGSITEAGDSLVCFVLTGEQTLSDAYRYDVPAASLRFDIPAASLRFDIPSIAAAITL